jgi:hypothetical protein
VQSSRRGERLEIFGIGCQYEVSICRKECNGGMAAPDSLDPISWEKQDYSLWPVIAATTTNTAPAKPSTSQGIR